MLIKKYLSLSSIFNDRQAASSSPFGQSRTPSHTISCGTHLFNLWGKNVQILKNLIIFNKRTFRIGNRPVYNHKSLDPRRFYPCNLKYHRKVFLDQSVLDSFYRNTRPARLGIRRSRLFGRRKWISDGIYWCWGISDGLVDILQY